MLYSCLNHINHPEEALKYPSIQGQGYSFDSKDVTIDSNIIDNIEL